MSDFRESDLLHTRTSDPSREVRCKLKGPCRPGERVEKKKPASLFSPSSSRHDERAEHGRMVSSSSPACAHVPDDEFPWGDLGGGIRWEPEPHWRTASVQSTQEPEKTVKEIPSREGKFVGWMSHRGDETIMASPPERRHSLRWRSEFFRAIHNRIR